MTEQPEDAKPQAAGDFPIVAVLVLTLAIFGCSIYANLSFAITNPADYRYFPPFKSYVNANTNGHLGGEAFNIACSLARGDGFADPFVGHTGPTAWMPPVLPSILAGLLWLCNGSRDAVMGVVVFIQVFTLIGTGVLVLALIRQTTTRISTGVVVTVYLLALLCNFRFCFQTTRDCWLVLLALDVLIAALCWTRPLHRWQTAIVWGLFGGLCAQINPIVGLTWGLMSVCVAVRQSAWTHLGIGLLAAMAVVAPWTIRNYLVFGRWFPVKSNLAYELYQSQLLEPDGLMQNATIALHPHSGGSVERQEYDSLGEAAYLDRKRSQFWQGVWNDPQEYLSRVGQRFLGATLWYVPFDRVAEPRNQAWTIMVSRLTHPLPFLAMLILLASALRNRLAWMQWVVIGVYVLYLLPYIGASYMERYAIPLLGVKVLLVIFGLDRLRALWAFARMEESEKRQTQIG